MKKRQLGLLLLMTVMLWSCGDTNNEPVANALIEPVEIVKETDNEEVSEPEETNAPEVVREGYDFIQGEEAVAILAADDDYTVKFSAFDYASKYYSDRAMDASERAEFLKGSVLEWSDAQKETVDQAMIKIQAKLEALNIDMPDIQFIITIPSDEGGSAGYTRQHAIALKASGIRAGKQLEDLIVHEMFHVYSRVNKALRKDMYAVINYLPCDELIIPEALVDLTIANPDAPDNNFYINGNYQGEQHQFVPLIYANAAYDLEQKASFFSYLNDDMLLVEVIDNVAHPVLVEGQAVLVKKSEITDYMESIGENTYYTFHPEETMADNFVMLVMDYPVKSEWVVEGLKKIVSHQ